MELVKTEKQELSEIATKCNVDINQAEQLTLGLKPFIDERALLIEEFQEVSKLEISLENISVFKALRTAFQKNRTQGISKWHKAVKEVPLRMSQLIDAVNRAEIQINEAHESILLEKEKFFEIQEQKRLEALQLERVELLSLYLPDAGERDLASMEDDVWNAYFESKKKAYEDNQKALKEAEEKRLEQERKTKLHNERNQLALPYYQFWSVFEQSMNFGEVSDTDFENFMNRIKSEKKEHEKKQELIRKEKERLEKEADENRKKEQALKLRNESRNKELAPYIIFIRDYNKLLNLDEKEYQKEFSDIKIGAEQHWEYERKEKALKAEKERKEAEEIQRLKAELKAKEEAERIEKQKLIDDELARKKAEKAAILAPDKDKLLALAVKLSEIKMPELKSVEADEILKNIVVLISKTTNYIKEKANAL